MQKLRHGDISYLLMVTLLSDARTKPSLSLSGVFLSTMLLLLLLLKLFQLCPTLCNPMDSSPPGSSVHRILQARILEWVASGNWYVIQLGRERLLLSIPGAFLFR